MKISDIQCKTMIRKLFKLSSEKIIRIQTFLLKIIRNMKLIEIPKYNNNLSLS